MAPNYITPAGFRRLADELTRLRTVDRPKICQEVADAAAQGDRSENAEYIYGKKKLREIDRRMHWLTKRLEIAKVVDPKEQRDHRDRVFFGATVEVEDDDGEEHVYQIVGADETDASAGKISMSSPIGGTLLGKKLDEEVEVRTPAGIKTLTITRIRYV